MYHRNNSTKPERQTQIRGHLEGYPGGSGGKKSACKAGDPGLIPGLGRFPGGGQCNSLHYSCLENSMDRGAWRATYSPWGHKELETTEATNTHTHTHTQIISGQKCLKSMWEEKILTIYGRRKMLACIAQLKK